MRIIDLSAPIAPSPPDAAPFERVELKYTSHAEGAAQAQAMLCVPPASAAKRRGLGGRGVHEAGHPQRHPRRCPLALQQPDPGPAGGHDRRTAPGVVLRRRRGPGHDRIRPTARGSGCRTSRPPLAAIGLRAPAAGHRAGADGAGRLLRPARLRAAGLRGDARGDPLDVRAGRPGHGDRRLGLGRAAGPAGQGGAGPAGSRGSSGRPTSRTCLTRRSSGWSTWGRCRPSASRWPASR